MKKLLIVDDELCLTEVLSRALKKGGYDVVTACDGEDGFAIACGQRPALIVSDYQMPGWDGVQMALHLRQNPATSEIPIILLTARGHRLESETLAATRIKAVISKPFSARQLKAKVEDLLKADACKAA